MYVLGKLNFRSPRSHEFGINYDNSDGPSRQHNRKICFESKIHD